VEEVRAIAKVKLEDEKDQRLVVVRLLATIASRTPLKEDYMERIVGRGPPAALVKMLYATVRGETGKVVGMLRGDSRS
jgi:hypothetical protein